MKNGIHIALIALTFGALIGYALHGILAEPRIEYKEKVTVEYIHDTISEPKPVYVTKTILDTAFFAVVDTLWRNDTLYMPLPRTQKTYMSPDYNAWVSGIEPNLDSLKIYRTNKVITKEIEVPVKYKKKWNLSVATGPGIVVTPKGDVKGGWGLVGGVSYSF